MSRLLTALLLLLAICPLMAEDGRTEKILELFDKLRLGDQMRAGMQAGLDTSLGTMDSMGLNPAMKDKMKKTQKAMMDYMETEIGFTALKGELVKIYAKRYTDEDIKGMIAFLDTPLGRKMADNQILILTDTQAVVAGKMKTVAIKAQQIMMQEMGRP